MLMLLSLLLCVSHVNAAPDIDAASDSASSDASEMEIDSDDVAEELSFVPIQREDVPDDEREELAFVVDPTQPCPRCQISY